MRKAIINSAADPSSGGQNWLDLEGLAVVEVTSESRDYPVESALIPNRGSGWRAETSGEQTIRLVFDHPINLGRILIRFSEPEEARTQEFVLRWLPESQYAFQEIVRQQYTFSPAATSEELEDYRVELQNVVSLELRIIPDISGGPAHASLAQLSLA